MKHVTGENENQQINSKFTADTVIRISSDSLLLYYVKALSGGGLTSFYTRQFLF